MNRNIGTIIVGFIGLLMGFVVIVKVTSGQGNSLASAAKFVAIGSFVFGLLKPKAALIWIIVLCGYSDLLKRLMVFDTSFNYLDISFVLGMAPACLAGMTLGCLGQGGIRAGLRKSDVVVFLLCSLYLMWVVVKARSVGAGLLGTGKVAFLEGSFVYAAFVGKVLFREREEMVRYFRICVYLFLPVAAYGIYQGFVGLSRWEVAYLESGFSIELRQLYDHRARAFSTLSAASTLTVICALFSLFVITQSFGASRSPAKVLHPLNFLLLCTFICAGILTYTRSGWLAFFVGFTALFFFQHRFTTIMYYVGGLIAFLILFFGADYALQHLDEWQRALTGGHWTQAFRITTWSDRLIGWRNLTHESGLWTPFGFSADEILRSNEGVDGLMRRNSRFFYHDAFTGFVLHRGYIPLVVLIIAAIAVISKIHRRIFSLDPDNRAFAICLFACVVCVGSVGATHAKILQFPVNFFFWIVVGCLVRVLGQVEEKEAVPVSVTEETPTVSADLDPSSSTPAWSYYNN